MTIINPHNLPPHVAIPAASLVGPLIWFRRQPVAVTSSPPTNTNDPRYIACTEHHLACDCREAERSEDLHEYKSALHDIGETIRAASAGHPTFVYVADERRTDLECRCTSCVVARILPSGTWMGRWDLTKQVGR